MDSSSTYTPTEQHTIVSIMNAEDDDGVVLIENTIVADVNEDIKVAALDSALDKVTINDDDGTHVITILVEEPEESANAETAAEPTINEVKVEEADCETSSQMEQAVAEQATIIEEANLETPEATATTEEDDHAGANSDGDDDYADKDIPNESEASNKQDSSGNNEVLGEESVKTEVQTEDGSNQVLGEESVMIEVQAEDGSNQVLGEESVMIEVQAEDGKGDPSPDLSTEKAVGDDNNIPIEEERTLTRAASDLIEDAKRRLEASASMDSKAESPSEEPFPEEEAQSNLLQAWALNTPASTPAPTSAPATAVSAAASSLDESPAATANDTSEENGDLLRGWSSRDNSTEESNVFKIIRKASVAVTGGALVLVGLPMIPMPTPGGVVVVGGGMAILATEFPAAQRALDRSRQGLANMVGDESDDDEEKKEKQKKMTKIADLVFEDEDEAKKKKNSNMMFRQMDSIKRPTTPKMINMDDLNELNDKVSTAAKGAKRNVKKFIRGTVLPLMERMTPSKSVSVASTSVASKSVASPLRMGNTRQRPQINASPSIQEIPSIQTEGSTEDSPSVYTC